MSDQQNLLATVALWSNAVASSQTLVSNACQTAIPVVTKLNQTHGTLGDEFTICGTNFCNAVAVYFNNAPAWFQVY